MAEKTHPHTYARRYVAALGAVALMVVVASGCGGSSGAGGGSSGGSGQTAAAFIHEVTMQFSRGQSGRLWDTLHPADQAVVARARYTACETNSGFELQKFKVLETYTDPVDIAGKTASATAVSVQSTSDDGMTTATMHAVSVKGSWRWILSPADYAAYKQGKCPPSS